MRLSFFVFVTTLTLAFSALAQTSLTDRHFEKGTRAARAGQFELAIEKYRQAILFSETEKTSDDLLARIHFNIGVCLFNLKRTIEAAEEFTEAIKLSRRNYQKAFYALGMAESELKNWRAAETAFREAVRLKQNDGEAWFDLGLVLLEREDFDRAETAFQKAIKFESAGAADAHNNLGVIFALKANFSAAETEFKTALTQSKGQSIEARNNLQFCKLYRRNFNQNLLARFEFSRKYKQGE
jgi:Flp pilus assembly protein TadD